MSAALAIQYAPLAPVSRITAIVVLFAVFTAFAISSVATGVPPGLFISNIIALISSFSCAFSISSIIVELFAPLVNVSSVVVIAPLIGITAMFPFSMTGANALSMLRKNSTKIIVISVLIPMLIILHVFLSMSHPLFCCVNCFFAIFFTFRIFRVLVFCCHLCMRAICRRIYLVALFPLG